MNLNYVKYTSKYQKTPKGRFTTQRANALARGIEWQLTFDEWWELWEKSGKWDQRGRGPKHYCMARRLDVGPYSLDNVVITTNRRNNQEGFFHKITTKA
jgi:hypothetical protein